MTDRNVGREIAGDAADAVAAAIYKIGEDVLGGAQRGAPKDEGTLRASGSLDLIVCGARYAGAGSIGAARSAARAAAMRGSMVTIDAEISFNTPYAARQHEELGWQHPNGGHAKYLELELARVAPRVAPILEAAKLTGALGTFPGI